MKRLKLKELLIELEEKEHQIKCLEEQLYFYEHKMSAEDIAIEQAENSYVPYSGVDF